MVIRLTRELNRVKNGYSAAVWALGLAAHGPSPEMADRNLERTVRLFLGPSQRAGTLVNQLDRLQLRYVDDGDELRVEVEQGQPRSAPPAPAR